ncbi:hypothetical protein ACFX11_004221 [Malus domestica]
MGLSQTKEMTGSKSSCFTSRTRVPTSDLALLMLRRDRVDKESSDVMYISIDSVRVTGGVKFEVYENNDMVLCGSLEWWRVFGSMEMRRD